MNTPSKKLKMHANTVGHPSVEMWVEIIINLLDADHVMSPTGGEQIHSAHDAESG
jgi:hypothetical protein